MDDDTTPPLANLKELREHLEAFEETIPRLNPQTSSFTHLHVLLTAINRLDVGIVITDPHQWDNPIIFTNPGFSQMTGYSPEEVLGKNCRFLQGERTDPQTIAELKAAVEKGEFCTVDILNYRKNGEPFWNQLTIDPIVDETGQITHFMGFQRDITLRKRVERALDVMSQRLTTILDKVPLIFYATDAQGRFTLSEGKGLELLGRRPGEVIGLSIFDIYRNNPMIYAAVEGALRGESRHTLVQINQFYFDAWYEPLYDEHDQIVGMAGVASNVTERILAEQQMRQQSERLQALYQILTQNPSDINTQLDQILHLGTEQLELDLGIISHIQEGLYTIIHSYPPDAGGSPGQTFLLEETYCHITFQQRDMVAIDFMGHSRYQAHPCYEAFKLETYIGVPLWINQQRYGTLNFTSAKPHARPFTPADKELIRLMGQLVSAALERQQAENELRENQQFVEKIVETSSNLIFIKDEYGNFLMANQALADLLGVSKEQLLFRNHADLHKITEENEAYNRHDLEVLKSKKTIVFEQVFTKPNGEVKWFQMIKSPFERENGRVDVLSIGTDITGRKTMEIALLKREEESHLLQTKLHILHEVTIELSKAETMEQFYRQAIILGREKLGFDRLGLLLYDEENNLMKGTFGTDEDGNLRDERYFSQEIHSPELKDILENKKRLGFWEKAPILDNGREIGRGWNAMSVLWDGDKGLGWLATDNWVKYAPPSQVMCDILVLYGATLGHLLKKWHTEEKLIASQNRHQAMLTGIPDLMFRFNDQGVYLDFKDSQTHRDLYVSPNQFLGKDVFDVLPAEMAQTQFGLIQKALQTGEVQFYEYQLEIPGEGVLDYEARFVQSGPEEVLAIIRNITGRKQTEIALKKHIEELSTLNKIIQTVNSFTDLNEALETVAEVMTKALNVYGTDIVVLDRSKQAWIVKAQYFNGQLYRDSLDFEIPISNVELNAAILERFEPYLISDAQNNPQVIQPRRKQLVQEHNINTIIGLPLQIRQKIIGRIGLLIQDPHRVFAPEELNFAQNIARQVAGAIENAQLYTAAQQEITERRQAQEALMVARDEALRASKFKSQLLARVSHELRTPLGAILGYTELLHTGMFGEVNSQQRQIMDEVMESTLYLTNIVNQLLEQAQLDAHQKVLLEQAPYNPAELVKRVAAQMEILAHNKKIQFYIEIMPNLPPAVVGDERRVQQILVNLLGNAFKFTREGFVKLKVDVQPPKFLTFQVEDSGIGIPAAEQTRIFEPFHQVDGSLTREQPGSGLGLSIVQQLVTAMKGEILVDSTPGRGSRFTLLLPLQLTENPTNE